MTKDQTPSAKKKRGASLRKRKRRPGLRQVTELDPSGVEVTHHRTVDTLGMMLTSGAITSGMHVAGRDFQAAFTIACFDAMPRVNLMMMARLPSGVHAVVREFTDKQIAARERVARAIDALGGHSSPAGSCIWHVIGMQTSIREWALRQGWGGRPVRQESAQGILVAALGVLVKHYGIRDIGGRRCA